MHTASVNTIIYMQTLHETLLVISIIDIIKTKKIDGFCAQLILFCETQLVRIFSSCLTEHKFQLESFRTGTENTTLFHENCNVLEHYTIFSINRISFAENHPLMRSTKFESISFCI